MSENLTPTPEEIEIPDVTDPAPEATPAADPVSDPDDDDDASDDDDE